MTTANTTILVINPGSTSTKLALYRGEKELYSANIEHSKEELAPYPSINDQLPLRKKTVLRFLQQCDISLDNIDAIATRGGVVGKLESGAYLIDAALVEASLNSPAPHPANLAPVIGHELAKDAGSTIPAYLYDAVCGCGSPERLFLYSGFPELERVFLTHVLNSRAVAIEQAKREKKELADRTYIVVHMGGGITTNLLQGGKIIDLVADDEGTFSPERSGGVPCRKLVKLCYSGKYSEKEMQKRLKGAGGLMAYLGTNDLLEVERRIDEGDKEAERTLEAMALQIAKDIGSLAPVVAGELDAIILTGGLAFSEKLTSLIKEKVSFLAEVAVIPGSFEMEALAQGILRVMQGEEQAKTLKNTQK